MSQIAAGILAAMILAQSIVAPGYVSSWYQLVAIGCSVAALIWLGLKGNWLTVSAGVAALVALFASARFLYRILDTWPILSFESRDMYQVALTIVATAVCALSLKIRDRN
jgi:hypothetical protein